MVRREDDFISIEACTRVDGPFPLLFPVYALSASQSYQRQDDEVVYVYMYK